MSIDVNRRNQRGSKRASKRQSPTLGRWLVFLGLSFTFAFCVFRFAFAISWPQSGFQHWQTAFNPVETLLEPLPDLFWWSGDVIVTAPAVTRGRAWSPIAIDFG